MHGPSDQRACNVLETFCASSLTMYGMDKSDALHPGAGPTRDDGAAHKISDWPIQRRAVPPTVSSVWSILSYKVGLLLYINYKSNLLNLN